VRERSKRVVVPGNHDGVHLGHRALLAQARARAWVDGWEVAALTFDPHPLAVLAPERAPVPLTMIGRRCDLLREAGADLALIERFDSSYAAQSASQWVEQVLVGQHRAGAVVVGPDFRFGAGRAGDLQRLREIGGPVGLEVLVAEAVLVDGERASSTRVRQLVAAGDVEAARALLGRPHEVEGTVVHGHHRGRTLGFPTANLDPDPVLAPADGVYAVLARVLGDAGATTCMLGVANLGTRPTFAAGRSLEVHLLDFDGDLYGRRLRVGFVARLRGEQKFDGIDALGAQIRLDAAAARARLSREGTLDVLL